ncbi:MAG: glycosyltransferase family 4 protein [Bacteroidales bacterium]|nr:glycosyltransferase family 4 protein [Bacteroidales bacterium]
MNLLFYCSEYPPYKSGGIGTVTKIVAEELVRRGHNVSVIGYYPDINESFVEEWISGVRVMRYNLGYRNTRLKERFFVLLRKIGLSGFITKKELAFIEDKIETFIHDNQIDILELTDYYPFVLCDSKLTFRKFSVPTVLRVHGSASFIQNFSGEGRKIYEYNDERHFQRCDYVSSVSMFSMEYIRNNFNLPDIKSWNVIYNPIEKSFLKKSEPVDNDNVLFIGKLTETKGCFSLIKAFNICAGNQSNLHLRLAGIGDEEAVKAIIDSRFSDRVHFLGYCDRDRLKEEIDNCSFACIPSYFESFGMVAVEVMGRGRTIIYTDRTSGPELISDSVEGYLVDPDNIADIAAKINVLLDHHEQRDRMAARAYDKIVSSFSITKVILELEAFYSSL